MKKCLICKERNIEEYGICEACKEFNEKMRNIYCDLSGHFAVVTGGRIKIGYATCLRLLRQGASVIAITRYPKSALENYMQEQDYEDFKDRLYILGFDLIRIDRINELVSKIEEICNGKLDILINNAAQTVKKSNEYYAKLLEHEKNLCLENKLLFPMVLSDNQNDSFSLIPNFQVTNYGETENENSWVRKMNEISPQEFLEVQLINVSSPFLLTSGLRRLLKNSDNKYKFIINVSSVEGRFYTTQKLARHVHTNMAKASLNMMTHSIAKDFRKDNIFVYSSDPGWVSNQFPANYKISKEFVPYLSFDDGATRVLYPITKNINEKKEDIRDYGFFYKDFTIIEY